MIKNVWYQFVPASVGEAALTAAVEDIMLALADGRYLSARTPACRFTESRSRAQQTFTRPSKMPQS